MRSKGQSDSRGLYAILSSGGGVEVWDFKREEGNLWEDGKSTCFVNKCLPCYTETVGHREDWSPGPAKLPPAHHS